MPKQEEHLLSKASSSSATTHHPHPTKSQRSTADYSLSCAECRRLKLKCPRTSWPCETCIKRGIAHLCPDGVQRKEKGSHSAPTKTLALSNFIANNGAGHSTATNQAVGLQSPGDRALYSRLESLERKIDKLLGVNVASSSNQRLPLPSNGSLHDLASIATNDYATSNEQSIALQDDAMRRQHGTLTLHPDGRAHYMGSNAHSMYLAQEKPDDRRVSFRDDLLSRPGSPTPVDLEAAAHPSHHQRNRVESAPGASPEGNTPSTIESQPAQLVWATPGFRSPHSSTAIWNHLKPVLPLQDAALRMIDVYYATVTFMFHPIIRSDFDKSVWSVFYSPSSPNSSYAPPANFHPHKLALLYSMLSLGVLMDVRRPQRDPVGRALYSCAWNALALSNFTEATSLEAILALMHINMYLTWRRGGKYAESAYPLLGTMVRMAISTGLHRDPSLFRLDEPQQERRRRVFWDIQCSDVFRAFAFCRPPALCDRHVDTKLPLEWQQLSREESNKIIPLASSPRREGIFHHFKCRQIQIINQMLDECLCVRPTYQTTTKFDISLRKLFELMPSWMMPLIVDFDSLSTTAEEDLEKTYSDSAFRDEMILEMQRHTTLLNHHQALLLLHRSWFSRALYTRDQNVVHLQDLDQAQIQARLPIFASITAVNESASHMIAVTISIWCKYPALVIRWAFFWNALFSAAVCRGLYVLKCRRYKTDEIAKAWKDLERAIELFTKAVIGWAPLESPLAILRRLHKRAQLVMDGEIDQGDEEEEEAALVQDTIEIEGEEFELIGDERGHGKEGKRMLEPSLIPNKRRKKASPLSLSSSATSTSTPQRSQQQQQSQPLEATHGMAELYNGLLDPNVSLPTFDFSAQMDAGMQSLLNPAMLPPLFDNSTSVDNTSPPGSASASQLIQMLSNGMSWDDVSSWNDLIIDL